MLPHFLCTGADVFIQKTDSLSYETDHECGRNLTLSCQLKKNTFASVWKIANKITPIAHCVQNVCDLNPDYVGQYSISSDMTLGVFNLTIQNMTKKDNGRKLICSDGSHFDSYIVRVRDYKPRLFEYTQFGTIEATSGCVSQDTNVIFRWIKISAISNIEKEFSPEIRSKNTTSCSNDSDCGNDQHIQCTEMVSVKPNDDGNYYIKIVAVYKNVSKESDISVGKFMFEDKDDESSSFKNGQVKTDKIFVGLVFIIPIVLVICVYVLLRSVLVRIRRQARLQMLRFGMN